MENQLAMVVLVRAVREATRVLACSLLGACAGNLEPRLRSLEERNAALDARVAALEASARPSLEVDGETGRVVPRPTEAGALDCAYRALEGVLTAEFAHDAAFDSWEADLEKLGFTLDTRGGCDRMVALRVTVDGARFDAVAVVVAAPARGRWYHGGKDGKVIDGGTMPEADVAAIEAASTR